MRQKKINKLIDLWIEAENSLRDEKYKTCEKLKSQFSEDIKKLTENEKKEVIDYLESIGG